MTENEFVKKVDNIRLAIVNTLVEKNRRYGNAALEPLGAFNKLGAWQGICVRLDDKASRVLKSEEIRKNDLFDILGYKTLYVISLRHDNITEYDFRKYAIEAANMIEINKTTYDEYVEMAENGPYPFKHMFGHYIEVLKNEEDFLDMSVVSNIVSIIICHFIYNDINDFTDQLD